jgi:hypothetical protein
MAEKITKSQQWRKNRSAVWIDKELHKKYKERIKKEGKGIGFETEKLIEKELKRLDKKSKKG